eukprot:Opistho-2@18551
MRRCNYDWRRQSPYINCVTWLLKRLQRHSQMLWPKKSRTYKRAVPKAVVSGMQDLAIITQSGAETVANLVGDVRGKSVITWVPGAGVLAAELLKRGADKVAAIGVGDFDRSYLPGLASVASVFPDRLRAYASISAPVADNFEGFPEHTSGEQSKVIMVGPLYSPDSRYSPTIDYVRHLVTGQGIFRRFGNLTSYFIVPGPMLGDFFGQPGDTGRTRVSVILQSVADVTLLTDDCSDMLLAPVAVRGGCVVVCVCAWVWVPLWVYIHVYACV